MTADLAHGCVLTIPVLVALLGCATPDRLASEASPPFLVVAELPSSQPIRSSTLFPLEQFRCTFDIVLGGGAGETIAITRSPTTRFGAEWTDIEKDVLEEFYTITADGGIALVAAIDHRERVISRFNPPLISAPPSLAALTPLTQNVDMRVVELANPRRVRESGTATQTIEYLGMRLVRTSDLEFPAHCVSVQFEAKLQLARATRTSLCYYVDGVGLVAAEHHEKVVALGVFNREIHQTLLRSDLARLIEMSRANGR
jgi:hypothetical protein